MTARLRPTPVRSATHIPEPTHTVEIRMPIDMADQLIAKAGTMDDAVHQALTAYLRTDIESRDAQIKDFVAQGKSVENLAKFHGMTTDDIMKIANR